VGVLDHLDGLGDLMRVEGNADHIQDTLLARHNLLAPVALGGVRHRSQFQTRLVRVMTGEHPIQIGLVTKLPGPNCAEENSRGEFL
jgi:hypothetical protein